MISDCTFQVMLLANPSIEELYHKSCALAEDSQEVRDSFQHPARLIKVQHISIRMYTSYCKKSKQWWIISFINSNIFLNWTEENATDHFVFFLVVFSTSCDPPRPVPHPPCYTALWCLFVPLFSFWWAWEVKMRPWPLVATGLPLWMELTQRRILQS